MKYSTKNLFVFMLMFSILCIRENLSVANAATETVASINEQALTLRECYQLAFKQSELIAVDAARLKEAEARFSQAFGTLLPQVSFARSDNRQGESSSSAKRRSYEQKFVFKQTLFSGFKEFAGMSGSRLEKKQFQSEKLRAEQLLFGDVSDAFYLLLETQENLKIMRVIEDSFAKRLEDLKARVELGKSRKSEVVSTEVQYYNLQADIESVKSQEQVARELLEFLVGKKVEGLVDTAVDFLLKSETEYYTKAATRADVKAAHYAWQVDQKAVTVAKGDFFPTLTFESNYYNHRASAPKDLEWDAALKLDVPIFEGTTTYGQWQEAKAKALSSQLLFQRAERLARQDIREAFIYMQSAMTQQTFLEKALKSAELNYDLQSQDYKRNLVNNLNVLLALQDLENARKNFVHVSYETKRAYWQLLVSAGEIIKDGVKSFMKNE